MLVDTWWQTGIVVEFLKKRFSVFSYLFDLETGGICISPCPADPNASITPAIAMRQKNFFFTFLMNHKNYSCRPFYGIRPVLVDEKVSNA